MHPFRPDIIEQASIRTILLQSAGRLAETPPKRVEPLRNQILAEAQDRQLDERSALELRIVLSVLCDLQAHGWKLDVDGQDIRVARPDRDGLDPMAHKDQVRKSLLVERDAQLREPATRRFVSNMERQHKHGSSFKSIFSLFRDGEELAERLERTCDLPDGPERVAALRKLIDPYVQVVERGQKCEHTGLDLQDIWRYFRHTWVTPYRSVPGRQLSFLIRDRAAENHPIIGIGSLASSIIQQKQRDKWIGWHPSVFFDELEADHYRGWPRWLQDQLDGLIADLYVDDFVEENVLTDHELRHPSTALVEQLNTIAKQAREAHRLYRQEGRHKNADENTSDDDWKAQAVTHLFRSKRARRLANLLQARADLIEAGFTKVSPERLRRAVETSRGRRAIRTVLRQVKASHVGIDMMDISVCGAVDPYRPILGGKLVSLLLASPDVVGAYADRYRGASSIIASSMAGRAVSRAPRLVLLMTTSLYEVASSQYNRLKVPPEAHGGRGCLEFVDLEHTAGFGSYHFSKTTMDAMEVLLARSARGREVNSIFGEGVNPKLRKVRAALRAVGLPSSQLLKHGSSRIVYGVPLATNFREILVGRARRPNYIVPKSEEGTRCIVDYWYERWLSGRIARKGVLDSVARHSTSHPVRHGARVKLPSAEEAGDLGPLFDEAEV